MSRTDHAGTLVLPFGDTTDGRATALVTLRCAAGVEARILTYGARLQALLLPGRDGRLTDCVLGYATLAAYEANAGYFGATIGRVANRIADGRFSLDGFEHRLDRNHNGTSTLHGGRVGFDKVVWSISAASASHVELEHISTDGDQGFPGNLTVKVVYRLYDDGALMIDHRATTDRPTIVNLTNHSLFNMAGEGSDEAATDNHLTIDSDAFTPVDEALIPTGDLRYVTGTPFDFRKAKSIRMNIRDACEPQIRVTRGYDHNFALGQVPQGVPRWVARLAHPTSGRALDLFSDQPGLQFYSGNNLTGTMIGKAGKAYRQGDGIALEPQRFPNTPNQANFGTIRLDPDQEYRNLILWRPTIIVSSTFKR